ncbi:helix-turn-helix transcriptional regulator [Nonomuraea angiospora]|uniref:helix-turn-helix domain-containing protein n=1 Tax=Nonomuraea angiospora TaxID=46172 RepID=UPI003413AE3C
MSRKDEVREFLISCRADVTPEQAGLPDYGGERRVPGLRREEVAMLAGVSVDYCTQLERGKIRGASEGVLNAIARARQLNDVEREYPFDLARSAPTTPATSRRDRRHLRRVRTTRRTRPGHLRLQRRRALTLRRQARPPLRLGSHPRVRRPVARRRSPRRGTSTTRST